MLRKFMAQAKKLFSHKTNLVYKDQFAYQSLTERKEWETLNKFTLIYHDKFRSGA